MMNADALCAAIVIPAYNEAPTIRDVARRGLAQLPLVIVVDDCSSDDTAGQLAGLPVVLLRNAVNLGKAGSLCRGAAEAVRRGAELVVTLDGDGQHAPEDIPRLLEAERAARGHIIIGSRLHQRSRIPAPATGPTVSPISGSASLRVIRLPTASRASASIRRGCSTKRRRAATARIPSSSRARY
jgi:glycosyltransferase involved in cell wall biosynthesis